MAEHGEVLRWSTDSGEDECPQKELQSVEQATVDSEEPTEFGVVWEWVVIRETDDMAGGPPSTRLEITTRNNDTIGIWGSNAGSPSSSADPIAMEEQSPCLSEYENEGFLSRRKALSKPTYGTKPLK